MLVLVDDVKNSCRPPFSPLSSSRTPEANSTWYLPGGTPTGRSVILTAKGLVVSALHFLISSRKACVFVRHRVGVFDLEVLFRQVETFAVDTDTDTDAGTTPHHTKGICVSGSFHLLASTPRGGCAIVSAVITPSPPALLTAAAISA